MYYTKDTTLFLNGSFTKAADTHTDLYSQTLHYGFGVFEGIRAYETANGVKLFKAFEHFERLKRSCQRLGIKFDRDTEELISISYQLIQKNELTDAYIRPLVYCGPNMYLTVPNQVNFMICAFKWGKYHGHRLLNLCVSSYQRPNPASIHVDAKVTGHYVNGILATNDAKQRGYDEALLLDMNGNVAAAPAANFFMEKDGVLITPPLGHIFPSITREVVLGICRELEINVQERHINPHELEAADSAFLCGTAVEIAGIESIDAHKFSKPWQKTIGAVIQEAYKSQVLDKSFNYVII